MSCNPTRILLSNTATTTMNVTLSTDPGDGTSVTFQVDGLGITETQTTTSAVAVFTITANTAGNNSLWDATLQVGTNTAVEASVQAVETNGAQTIGVTLSDAAVTYCSPLGGGGGDATSLTGPVLFNAKNATGVTITKGSVVYIDGVSGNTPTVALADADDAAKMPAFGLAYADLADAATGSIITFGDITNLDTDGFVLDNPLYVSTTPGVLTQTKPAGETSLIQNIGLVTRVQQSSGRIKVTGAGRSNDTPNLDDGNIFIGNASNQVTTAALSTLTGVTSITGGSLIDVDQATGVVEVSHAAKALTGSATPFPSSITVDSFGHVIATGISKVPLEPSNNLSDLISDSTARTNLGLTTAATTDIGTTAGDLIVLDGSARLPAVDGSQLTNLPGGGSTDWKWDPESTTYIRIFDDFFGQGTDDITGYDSGSATRFAALTRSDGYWKSWISNDTFENTGFDLRGFIRSETTTSTTGRCLWTVPQCVTNSPSDGDEAMIEVNIKPTVNVAGSSTAQWWISIFRNDNNQTGSTTESSMNYGDLAKFGLAAEGANTNWFSYSYDNAGTAGSPTETDLGASYPISETTFTRVGLHYKYVSASTKYVCKAFINGTQVATFDITTGTGAPYIQGGIYNNSTGAVHSCLWDYAVLQYTAPTVTWKNITAV